MHDSDTGDFDPESFIDQRCRDYASRRHYSRTGEWVPPEAICGPYDKAGVPTYDLYGSAWLRAWQAYLRYDATRDNATSVEAFIGWHIFGRLADDFFDAPIFVPKGTALAYLDAVDSSLDANEQRQAWLDAGRKGTDFDHITSLLYEVFRTPGDEQRHDQRPASDAERGDSLSDPVAPPPDFEVEQRLFVTDDLNELERWVWRLRQEGWSNAEVAERIPVDLLGDVADPANKVSKTYSIAKAKAQRFWIEL